MNKPSTTQITPDPRQLINHNVDIKMLGEVKADAGYFFLELCRDNDGEVHAYFYPVLLWALESETYFPYPVTQGGVKIVDIVVMRPDGMVTVGFDDIYYDSLSEWLESENASGAVLHNGGCK
jgi:hypothetical protein